MNSPLRQLPGLGSCIVLALLGEWLRLTFDLPLPGGVVGLFLLLAGLAIVPPLYVRIAPGADLLLDNLILFFIPAVMSVISHPQFFGILGLKLLFILIFGTAIMMASVGLFAEAVLRLKARKIGGESE